MPLLMCNEIRKVYGGGIRKAQTVALRNLDLSVEHGEVTAVMGPSGSGKTTLLNLIATIDRPTSGSIVFEELDVTKLRGTQLADFRRDRLGFVFQDANLLDTLTVGENIILPLALSGIDSKTAAEKVDTLADLLGIQDILDKFPMETSGGQRQRGAVARALSTNPGMLLADEPTGSLDSRNSREMMEYLLELQELEGTTVLIVTHDPLIASYCRRVVFIKDGSLFSEIRRGGDRRTFYSRVADVLTALEGVEEIGRSGDDR
jgi:putative ABC transport system ATP-binding protein